jgi:hypothetical protein
MVFARNEIEYLNSLERRSTVDPAIVDEMWHRLDALRCFEQNVAASDWQPHTATRDHHSQYLRADS